MQNYIHNISELIGLLVAMIYYPYLKGSFMKWFLPFLAFIFFAELYIKYEHYVFQNEEISLQYLIGIVESIFYGYIFNNFYTGNTSKMALFFLIFISVSSYLIGFFVDIKNYSYLINALVISGFFLSVVSMVYIYTKVINDDETLLIKEPGFWIAFGVSLFFSGTSIVFCLHDFIVKNNLNLFGVRLYNIIPRILCVVLYSSISIAIILCKKKNKISY
jgi:hypothetical protein